MKERKEKVVNTKNNKGFTLIELLVVVLIIGILAAIALPQYRAAVGKARFAALIPVVDGYKKAVESYYLTHGEYPTEGSGSNPLGLDILPTNCDSNTDTSQAQYCGNGVYYDIVDYGRLNVAGIDTVHKFAYIQWLFYSEHPNQKRCLAAATNAVANKVCQSFGGEEIEGEYYQYPTQVIGETLKVYSM